MNKIYKLGKEGQSMVEYVILFTVIVAVIVFAITTYIGPSVNRLYLKTSQVIDDINPTLNIN
ncbi:MAG: hypothetical protein ABIA97_04180 [Candidatus Omnitrophota bacterium]